MGSLNLLGRWKSTDEPGITTGMKSVVVSRAGENPAAAIFISLFTYMLF